jgi:hypothetical protein
MNRRSAAAPASRHPSQLLTLAIGADNGLHLVSSLAGVAIALWPARRPARAFSRRGV